MHGVISSKLHLYYGVLMSKLSLKVLFAFLIFPTFVLAQDVDLELVLAMDASGSISEEEYLLQLNGTADAFMDPGIQSAILSGPTGKIAVNIMLWSDAAFPKVDSGWFILEDEASILAFATITRRFKLTPEGKIGIGGGGTGIGAGILHGLKLIGENGLNGQRRVIDVSGDGIETEFWFKTNMPTTLDAKKEAARESVTVNGLPILSRSFPDLDQYYYENVIHGPGAFVVTAENFEDFSRAIREKLWREIAPPIAFHLQNDNNQNVAFSLYNGLAKQENYR